VKVQRSVIVPRTKTPGNGRKPRVRNGAKLIAGVVVMSTLVAACSSSSHPASSGTSSTPSGTGSAATGTPIKVMVIAPFTLAAAPSKANFDAVKVQAKLQNAKGGINGHPVDVIGCDDQNDANVAAACARQAVSSHVAALVGVFTLQPAAIYPIIEKAGIPNVGNYQIGAGDYTSPTSWPIVAPGDVQSAAAGAYLVKHDNCKQVGYLGLDIGAPTQSAIANVKRGVESAGGTFVGSELYSFSSPPGDFSPFAAAGLKKATCNFVSGGTPIDQLVIALYQQNPNIHLAAIDTGLPPDWAKAMGPAAAVLTQIASLPPTTSTAPGVQDYVNEMKAQNPGSALNFFSILAWASWYAFYNVAATIHGDVTAASMTAALTTSSAVQTNGMLPPVDFTKPIPYNQITRSFSTEVAISNAVNSKIVQSGGAVDARTLIPSLIKS
jgi:ABC-type branched-subunit amino acid transport system substrate-binding protein